MNNAITLTPKMLVGVVVAALAIGGAGTGLFASYAPNTSGDDIRLVRLEEKLKHHDKDMVRVEAELKGLNEKMDYIIRRLPTQ